VAGRYALIVATDEYEDARLRRLRAPARDAEALNLDRRMHALALLQEIAERARGI
jgi:hypothetical protein